MRINRERKALAQSLSNKPFYSFLKKNLHFDDYMRAIASSVFTLSPRGFGPDCYRTWEALLAGSIPIVKRGEYGIIKGVKFLSMVNCRNSTSEDPEEEEAFYPTPAIRAQLDRLYENLPVLVVDEWEEITEEFLEQKYKEITSKKYSIAPLYIDYWRQVIDSVRQEYLKNHQKNDGSLLDDRNLSRAVEHTVKINNGFFLLDFMRGFFSRLGEAFTPVSKEMSKDTEQCGKNLCGAVEYNAEKN